MRTIAVLNQKGGVGKTTTVVNIAAALAAAGSRVVVLDLDPQAHLTIHLGLEPQIVQSGSYKVLTQSAEFEQQIMLMRPNLWLLPANINLVGAESELVSVVGRETILREAMLPSRDKFDYCLIDCAPSLGLLTLNALAASEDVLIPLQPHFLALRGFGKLLQTVELVNKRINPNLKVKWVLLCMFDGRASLTNEVKDDIEQFLESAKGTDCPWSQAQILPVHIRRNIKLAEAPSYGKTIFEYEENCHGAEDYRKAAELIHAQFHPPKAADILQPVAVNKIQEQSPVPSDTSPELDSQVEQQPDKEPTDSQSVVTDEIQEQSPAPSIPSPESDLQTEQQPDIQPAETVENQNQAPIEIKSISPDQQQKEGDLEEQPSEFTQTTNEQSST
jgi:chromosome partitioning protein